MDEATWRLKRALQHLGQVQGAHTSLVTLLVPNNPQALTNARQLLAEELGTSGNIKSRTTRQAVQQALVAAQQQLKRFTALPATGLAVFAGVDQRTGKMVSCSVEPPQPMLVSLYRCDSQFHLASLQTMLQPPGPVYGVVVVDGHSFLLARVTNHRREIVYQERVHLPSKHGCGGQSAARFGRIRMEKRHNYLTKTAEMCTRHFVGDATTVAGVVIAGLAELKQQLQPMLDPRLAVLGLVDISYGGTQGLHEALDKAGSELFALQNVRRERELLTRFLEAVPENMAVYTLRETVRALEAGTVSDIVVWAEYAATVRDQPVIDAAAAAEAAAEAAADGDGAALLWVEWLLDHAKEFGAQVHLVSDQTAEAGMFIQGFGGLGGLLRYRRADEDAAAFEPVDDADLEDYL